MKEPTSTADLSLTAHVTCVMCKKGNYFPVPYDGWVAWRNGVHIQDAMPSVSAPHREMLISGVCPSCFDGLFELGDKEAADDIVL